MDGWLVARAAVVGLGAVWLGLALLVASDPAPDRTRLSQGLLQWGFLIGVSWVIYSISWLGVFAVRRRALVWLTVPLCPVVAAHALWTCWPLAARVWLCEATLRERAMSSRIDPFEHVDSDKAEPKRVGLFLVRSVSTRPDGTVVFFTGRICVTDHGVLYAPNGSPGSIGDGRVYLRHLYGPWYRYAISD